eukprot:Ihof_evm2s128 gene=Ihof_evmTU2s128
MSSIVIQPEAITPLQQPMQVLDIHSNQHQLPKLSAPLSWKPQANPLSLYNCTYVVNFTTSKYTRDNFLPFLSSRGRVPYGILIGRQLPLSPDMNQSYMHSTLPNGRKSFNSNSPMPERQGFQSNRKKVVNERKPWHPALYTYLGSEVACTTWYHPVHPAPLKPIARQTCALPWGIYDSGQAIIEAGLNESREVVENKLRVN